VGRHSAVLDHLNSTTSIPLTAATAVEYTTIASGFSK
jgi:hypothetical protein